MNYQPNANMHSTCFSHINFQYPEYDDSQSLMEENVGRLLRLLEEIPDAAQAVTDMSAAAIVCIDSYMDGYETEEFHLVRDTENEISIVDHFHSQARPGGNGLIIYIADGKCQVSDILKEKYSAFEKRLGMEINYSDIYDTTLCNQAELGPDRKCGCISCKTLLTGKDIKKYITEPFLPVKTAICPRCGMDSVVLLPEGITDEADMDELLGLLHEEFIGEE